MDPAGTNAFEIFGLEPAFQIDLAALRRAWLNQSARLHPDRPGAPEDAAEKLGALNWAKSVLEDPHRRAVALMAALGEPTGPQTSVLPPGFLVEMLEVRERMEEALAARDEAAIAALASWALGQRSAYERAFGERLEASGGRPSASDWGGLRTTLNAWKYIERMLGQLREAQEPRA